MLYCVKHRCNVLNIVVLCCFVMYSVELFITVLYSVVLCCKVPELGPCPATGGDH